MKQKKITDITEGISDLLAKSMDPRVLRDRRSQVIRTRDLALEAADEADKAGNSDLASQLRDDADRLQQVLDNTSDFADSSKAPTAKSDEDSSAANSDNDSSADETGDAASEGEEASEKADNDDVADADGDEQTSKSSNSTNSSQASPTTDQEPDQNGQNSGNTTAEEESDGSTSSSGGSSSENDEEFDDEEEDAESESKQSEDSDDFEKESADGQADDLDAEEDDEPFGTPTVKDDKILQNPFKSPQAEQQMPKDMMDKLNSGDLQIEPEIEAIIRIISKLKGEARRGAEQAIRDHYSSVDYWGSIEDEEDSI